MAAKRRATKKRTTAAPKRRRARRTTSPKRSALPIVHHPVVVYGKGRTQRRKRSRSLLGGSAAANSFQNTAINGLVLTAGTATGYLGSNALVNLLRPQAGAFAEFIPGLSIFLPMLNVMPRDEKSKLFVLSMMGGSLFTVMANLMQRYAPKLWASIKDSTGPFVAGDNYYLSTSPRTDTVSLQGTDYMLGRNMMELGGNFVQSNPMAGRSSESPLGARSSYSPLGSRSAYSPLGTVSALI